jgi:hypothetical protein
MDQEAAQAMIVTIMTRLESRSSDPRFTQTRIEALIWKQAAEVVRLEAEMAGLEL